MCYDHVACACVFGSLQAPAARAQTMLRTADATAAMMQSFNDIEYCEKALSAAARRSLDSCPKEGTTSKVGVQMR